MVGSSFGAQAQRLLSRQSVQPGNPLQKAFNTSSSRSSLPQIRKMLSCSNTGILPPNANNNHNHSIEKYPLNGFRTEFPFHHRNISTLKRNPLNQTQTAAAEPEDLLEIESPESDNYGEKLYLTPYIENGLIEVAQDLARVRNLIPEVELESYSGYLTVRPETGSNLFFWFFPAAVSHKYSEFFGTIMLNT